MVFIYFLVDFFDSFESSSLNNSATAPILPRVAERSAGKKILVALPFATFSRDSRYLIVCSASGNAGASISVKDFCKKGFIIIKEANKIAGKIIELNKNFFLRKFILKIKKLNPLSIIIRK